MEYFPIKVADIQFETLLLKRGAVMHEIFQNSLSVENFGVAGSFSRAV